MSRSKKERERISTARNAERQAESLLDRLNRRLYGLAADLLAGLITDSAGRLVFNVRNISTAQRVAVGIDGAYQAQSRGIAKYLVDRLLRLFRINTGYFREAVTPVPLTDTVENSVLRVIMAQYGFNVDAGTIDPAGYLAGNLRSNGHAQTVARRINEAIAAKTPLRQFMRDFRQDFNNPGSPLSARHHFNRFARDLYQEFDRKVNNTFAEELGLTYAIYSGTVKDNTRDFCKRRVNMIYTDEKIDEWNGQQWRGKNPNIDVRISLGGYNCRHVLSWISEETAQQLAKRRSIDINEYNPI